jgi:hypothetical protein
MMSSQANWRWRKKMWGESGDVTKAQKGWTLLAINPKIAKKEHNQTYTVKSTKLQTLRFAIQW